MKRRRGKPNCALCVVSVLLTAGGVVWLCFLSYRFLLITAALLLIGAGLLLKNNCGH
ncbi:MAG: hypothetical protein IK990_21395 [Ruminiclostridium sp.]|nr:hypothetical protein [Ruminiclostridium sp.]